MGFKRNIMIAFVWHTTNCCLGLIPILIMFNLFFVKNIILGLFYSILFFITLIFILNIIGLIISFIAQIFMKTKYYVNDDCLVIKTKKESKEIKYTEIVDITYYDYFYFSKGSSTLSQLVLFDKDNNQLLSIEHPSIIMVHLIIKKCKHIKAKYYNNKKSNFLILLIINIIALIIILLMKRLG